MRYVQIKRLTVDSLLIGVTMFCVFSYALLENVSIAIPEFSILKTPMLLLGTLCLLLLAPAYITKLANKKYIKTFSVLVLWFLLLGWSTYSNRNPLIGESPVKDTFRLITYLTDLFVLMVIVAEKGQSRMVLRYLYRYMIVLVVITDVLLLTRLVTFSDGHHEWYLIGTKFSVSYLHMNLLTLWMLNNEKTISSYRLSMGKVLLGVALIIAITIRIDCMSGLLGCMMLTVLFVLLESPKRGKLLRFTSPWFLLLFMIVSVVFAFVAQTILSLPAVEFVIEKILGRDSSLTGRTDIFVRYIATLPSHWLTGYGYGNAYAVTSSQFYYDNVQNALLQWILQVGVVTSAGLVVLLLQVFGQISWRNTHNMPKVLLLTALIYMYVILGSVEITYDMNFFLWFALIFMLAKEKTPLSQKNREAIWNA